MIIPATFMRGGTSKALMIKAEHLPADKTLWPAILCSAMGSPDPYGRQLNGMGGGVSSVSKVCVIGPPSRPDADVDFTFVQIHIREASVDMAGNCGNMLSAIGPFAVDEGLVPVSGDEMLVRIYNTNTDKIIHSHFRLKNGKTHYEGDLEIPGVGGTGSPIRLDFLNPGGAATGKFLPTGSVLDTLKLPDGNRIEASLFDAANPCVIVRAKDLGLTGTELPAYIDGQKDLMARIDQIRVAGSVRMGVGKTVEEANKKKQVPFVALLSPAADFVSISGDAIPASAMDFTARIISVGQPHQALPVTGTLCLAIASQCPGSIAHEMAGPTDPAKIRIGMPSGILTAAADVQGPDNDRHPVSGAFFRTARRLFKGEVYSDVGG
jgi:2-methylaconitate isomerase